VDFFFAGTVLLAMVLALLWCGLIWVQLKNSRELLFNKIRQFLKAFLAQIGLYRGVIFLRSAPINAAGLKGGRRPTKSLNDFRQGVGCVWIGLESGYQEGGV
jgi:hypothetical protein